jgi:hypothetical protein
MKIDKPEHQQFLLELMKAAQYPGHLIDLAYEVKQEIQNADVSSDATSNQRL